VLPAVWRLYARAIERCGPTATLLEWDDNIPTFDEVHAEALKATKFLKAATANINSPVNENPVILSGVPRSGTKSKDLHLEEAGVSR